MTRAPLLATLFFALCGPLVAQHPCFTNLVPNGDFGSLLVDPWRVVGPVAQQPEVFATDGVQMSPCVKLIPSTYRDGFSLKQDTPFTLAGQALYEFSLDVWTSNEAYFDVGLVDSASKRTVIGQAAPIASGGGRARCSVRFKVASGGPYTLDLLVGGGGNGYGGPLRLDNVMIRVARDTVFNVTGRRAAGANNTFEVVGPPNATFALFLTGAGFLPTPLPVPTCTGEWMLNLPALNPLVISFNATGVHTGSIAVPAAVRGVPIYWQTALLPRTCSLACPVMIGFP